jgi:hypothetical protein
MASWRFAITGGALTQIGIGLILHSGHLNDARARLGLALFGLAGGMALLGLVVKSVRGVAAALNGLVVLVFLPQLFIGLLEGFAIPDGSPLGRWLYPVTIALASTGLCNAVGLGQLHAQSLQSNIEPGAGVTRNPS